jgi:hypothetical protein
MSTCSVNINLVDIGFAPIAGIVSFSPAEGGVDRIGNSLVAPAARSVQLSQSGIGTIDVLPGRYFVTVGSDAGFTQFPAFPITVPDAPLAYLAQLIDLPPPADLDAAQQAVLDAQTARDFANASAAAAAASSAAANTAKADAEAAVTAAATAAEAADTSANAAAVSASQAATAAQNAASSATNASSSAATAASTAASVTASAAAAATSATNAANSAIAALASQSAAAASATGAAASRDSADSSANAAALSESASAASANLAAQKAVEASQFRDEASDAAAAASVAADRVSLGDLDDATASAQADAIAAASSAAASSASALQAETSRIAAAASATSASAASSAAFVNANAFADIATGRAAVADGQQFQVVTGDEIIRYRRDSSSTQTEVARYPAAQTATALEGALGQVSAVLGQTQKEVERLSAIQDGDAYTLRTLLEALSLIGQLADQINGGQVALRGGSLADPALRIGTAGIYSSAADTLSVAIAGVERLRVTATGITVFGTVTQV